MVEEGLKSSFQRGFSYKRLSLTRPFRRNPSSEPPSPVKSAGKLSSSSVSEESLPEPVSSGDITTLEKKLQNASNRVKEVEKELADKEEQLAEKENQIKKSEVYLKARDAQLSMRSRALAERDEALETKNNYISKCEAEIDEVNILLSKQNKELSEAHSLTREAQEAEAVLEKQLEKQTEKICDFESQLAAREETVMETMEQLQELKNKNRKHPVQGVVKALFFMSAGAVVALTAALHK